MNIIYDIHGNYILSLSKYNVIRWIILLPNLYELTFLIIQTISLLAPFYFCYSLFYMKPDMIGIIFLVLQTFIICPLIFRCTSSAVT